MPVYNGGKFLASAIESLLSQTLADFELIISDNGSTDSTRDICDDYAKRDSRIRYIRHTINRGATWNWNYVVHQARGPIFKWASANDYCDSQMLEKCASVIRGDPRVALCYPFTWLVDEEGRQELYKDDIEVLDERPSLRFMQIRNGLYMNNAQGGLIRTRALRQTRLERLYPHGDMILMAELALYGTYVLLREPLFYRRVDRASMSKNLTQVELQRFLTPKRDARFSLPLIRRHADCLLSVFRASIDLREKARGIRFAVGEAIRDRRAISAELLGLMKSF